MQYPIPVQFLGIDHYTVGCVRERTARGREIGLRLPTFRSDGRSATGKRRLDWRGDGLSKRGPFANGPYGDWKCHGVPTTAWGREIGLRSSAFRPDRRSASAKRIGIAGGWVFQTGAVRERPLRGLEMPWGPNHRMGP